MNNLILEIRCRILLNLRCNANTMIYLRPMNFKDAYMTYNPVKYYMGFVTQYILKMH